MYGEYLRDAVRRQRYEVSRHAQLESRNNGLSLADVERALLSGEIIESNPENPRGPTYLVGGYAASGKPVHVVVGLLPAGWARVMAVYVPSAEKWESDWKTRKGSGPS